MLLQKAIEEKIVHELKNILCALESVEVHGAWCESFAGLTRWSENPESDAFVSVALSTPSRNASTDPTATMSANVSVFVRIERDPTGEKLCEICERLQTLFNSWIGWTHEHTLTDLDTDDFSIDGIALGAGTSPTIQNAIAAVTYTLELSGSYT